ncbi:hypothetical protein C0Q70_13336 [Pomacea canaliculata]|uniref:Uncharacterized protein n=1 Tax=Pomacea canaliculata TaxID=400727 RepID=A0A2T7NWZ2_POMCA|nr:hypothetical protein C0Q70_13336 [Pomacea canaliculata]
MTSKAKKWMVGNLSSDDKTILGCEDNRCNNSTDNQQLAMASPTEVVKTKKSPSFSDSHHLFDAVRKGKIHLTRFILAASPNKLQNSGTPTAALLSLFAAT